MTANNGSGKRHLMGYARTIAGEKLNYYCFYPRAKTSLLTRCTGAMKIEWETQPVPEEPAAEFVYFVWIATYSTTTGTGERKFELSINQEKYLTFQGRKDHAWTEEGRHGVELSFRLVKEDFARDASGYMFLKVPASLFPKGKPLLIGVQGEIASVKDWYMVFEHGISDNQADLTPLPLLTRAGKVSQVVLVEISYLGDRGRAVVTADRCDPGEFVLSVGYNALEWLAPAVTRDTAMAVSVAIDGGPEKIFKLVLKPVPERTIYLLPHSHNDIGYSDLQADVMKKQLKNLNDALELIKQTAGLPPEARFKWNVEILWAVETFLRTEPEDKRREFISAVRSGSIGLQALYTNLLTGITRPEEFYRLTAYARSFKAGHGIAIRSAMITDIPGMTWNMIPTLAQSGVKYFSSGPNGDYRSADRVGHSNASWCDRPFWWVSPSGRERVLYWMAGLGYAYFHKGPLRRNEDRFKRDLAEYFDWLAGIGFPYDLIQLRYTTGGDNGPVDPDLPEFVRQWNERYVWPRLRLATVDELMEDFEIKYGSLLPVRSGDMTPYWEDGAASTARELGMVRTASERLVQAEALFAMLKPDEYDPARFRDAWENVLLFDEHTWGAWNSVSEPDADFCVAQWQVKERFAHEASARTGGLVKDALAGAGSDDRFEVINANSWPRTDLVVIPEPDAGPGDLVRDDSGRPVPSQRLSNGRLAFLAADVPPFGSRIYRVESGPAYCPGGLVIEGQRILGTGVAIELDPVTGGVRSLKSGGAGREWVDRAGSAGLNEYYYIEGLDPAKARTARNADITIKEHGPLVCSFLVGSEAPGAVRLDREIAVVSGLNRVDITNRVDKKKNRDHEAVHFGFPFDVPDPVVRIDLGFTSIRPEADQLAGSCKDFYSAQRWVDVSNRDIGITVALNETPLIEIGEMHSELPDPHRLAWKQTQAMSASLYFYVMNNYWFTNYKADQEGACVFSYSLRPHGPFVRADAARFGIERSQPLLVRRAPPGRDRIEPRFVLDPEDVIVTYLKPIAGGRGSLVRLYNAGEKKATARITPRFPGQSVYLSSPFEEKGGRIERVELPVDGIATVRIE